VLNKIDLGDLSPGGPGYRRDEYGRIAQIRLSAKTGEGLELVKVALSEAMKQRKDHSAAVSEYS
jgi:GTP-binding protein HflX